MTDIGVVGVLDGATRFDSDGHSFLPRRAATRFVGDPGSRPGEPCRWPLVITADSWPEPCVTNDGIEPEGRA